MLYDPQKMLLVAGPCSLESMGTCRPVAEVLVELAQTWPDLNIVFKGSFDKANRTSIGGGRGTGLEEGLAILARIKTFFGFPVLTDFHEPHQVTAVSEVADVLQIPALLCRQTDMLLAAANTGKAVNVKKGPFTSPYDMVHVVAKLQHGKAAEVWLTERGSTFGYHNLVVDMRGFSIMRQAGHPVIFDATHSVQLPSAGPGQSDGQREFVLPLGRAALAAGANGIFLETHPAPERAVSDGPSMVPLSDLPGVVESFLQVWRLSKSLAAEK